MQLKRVILGCAGGVMLAGAGAVQAASSDEFEGFKSETISAIFIERGAKEMKTEVVQGDPRLTFKIGETIYVVDFFLCQDAVKGCRMLQYTVAYELTAGDTVERVNRYNHEFVFGKASLDATEGLVSTRAVLGAAGSSKRILLAEFGAFVSATAALIEHMKAQNVAQAPASGTPAAAALSLPPSPDAAQAQARWASMPKNKR